MSDDTEKGRQCSQPIGFAGLADFIASDKEHSTSIYRQFERISARNILYIQSELRELELQQDAFDREDAAGDDDALASAMEWELLRERAEDPNNGKDIQRLELIKKIREKVKEYRE